MYLSYYGLSEKPFDISTDPKFLWLGEKHKEAFAVLKYGVMENKGFLLLTGDIGAGKTTLINALINSLGDDVIFAFIPDPGLELLDFYRYLSDAFGCESAFTNKADFIFMFREFLFNAYEAGKKVLLIIDEAQRLSNELLEEIRLLSNIELQKTKLLNIFFVGQAEFNTKLLEPENRSVRQRITINNHILPLTEKETGDYIRHRLKVAGSQKNIFSYVAIHEVYKFSGGYPRLINIVCDIALLTGYVRDSEKIGDDIVKESIETLNIESHTTPRKKEEIKEQLNHALGAGGDHPMQAGRASGAAAADGVKNLEKFSGKKKSSARSWVLICLAVLFLSVAVFMILASRGGDSRLGFTDIRDTLNSGKAFIHSLLNTDSQPVKTETPGENSQKMVLPYVDTLNSKDDPGGKGKDGALPSTENTPEPEKSVLPQNGKFILDFNRNSNDFSDKSYETLAVIAGYLKKDPSATVLIVGYTDNIGSYSYNVNLSSFRANSVKSFLVGQGIDKNRIRATGVGPDNPRAGNDTEIGREMNRRVEIDIITK
jgi:general secretion pathway protein A